MTQRRGNSPAYIADGGSNGEPRFRSAASEVPPYGADENRPGDEQVPPPLAHVRPERAEAAVPAPQPVLRSLPLRHLPREGVEEGGAVVGGLRGYALNGGSRFEDGGGGDEEPGTRVEDGGPGEGEREGVEALGELGAREGGRGVGFEELDALGEEGFQVEGVGER